MGAEKIRSLHVQNRFMALNLKNLVPEDPDPDRKRNLNDQKPIRVNILNFQDQSLNQANLRGLHSNQSIYIQKHDYHNFILYKFKYFYIVFLNTQKIYE